MCNKLNLTEKLTEKERVVYNVPFISFRRPIIVFIVNRVGIVLANLKLKPQNGASDYKHEYRGGQG